MWTGETGLQQILIFMEKISVCVTMIETKQLAIRIALGSFDLGHSQLVGSPFEHLNWLTWGLSPQLLKLRLKRLRFAYFYFWLTAKTITESISAKIPLRSWKAGRFDRVSLTWNSHPIVTRVSRAPPRHTTPSEEASPLFYIFMVY